MSLSSSMNIAQQALLANQAALSTVSNNISNLNTFGYSKQRVDFATVTNYGQIGGGAYGQIGANAGAEIGSLTRYTNAYLLGSYRDQSTDMSYLNEFAQIAKTIDGMTNELKGTGLQKAMEKFYDAATAMNLDPKDNVARLNFLQQAQNVVTKFNEQAKGLDDLRTDLVGDVNKPGSLDDSSAASTVKDINKKLEQIAKINDDIVKLSSGGSQPLNLLDQRDQLLNELSGYLPIEVKDNPNGTNTVKINGVDVIRGNEIVGKLEVAVGDNDNPAKINMVDKNGNLVGENINQFIDSGSLGAILDAGGSDPTKLTPKKALDQLNTLATEFAKVFNDMQTGTDASGKTALSINKDTMELEASTEVFFKSKDGQPISALNLQLNNELMKDPFKLALARADVTAPDYDPKAIGSNQNSLAIIDTRTASYAGLGNATFEGFVGKMTGDIGTKIESINTDGKTQALTLAQVSNQLASATGVNMDEEIMDLTKYQRAYEASARIYSVCTQLMDILVNLGR